MGDRIPDLKPTELTDEWQETASNFIRPKCILKLSWSRWVCVSVLWQIFFANTKALNLFKFITGKKEHKVYWYTTKEERSENV